jgi:ethanolamine utilization protein EutP (predicted NTPase)
LLPKIKARFYSANRKAEYYLAGYDTLLKKSQAIEWVETHKLDAVIVHYDQDHDITLIKSALNKKTMELKRNLKMP